VKAQGIGTDVIQTSQSILDTVRTSSGAKSAFAASECLGKLNNLIDVLENDLRVASATLFIASRMKDKDDEAIALKVAKASLAVGMKRWPPIRGLVHDQIYEEEKCRSNTVVRRKTKAFLDFVDEVDNEITPIARGLGVEAN
jgi:hypothetical protein